MHRKCMTRRTVRLCIIGLVTAVDLIENLWFLLQNRNSETFFWNFLMNQNETKFYDVWDFWVLAGNFKYYTYKPRVYGYTNTSRVFFRQKIGPACGNFIPYFRMRMTFWRLGCGKQMKTKGKRTEGIVFTNADPQYAGNPIDPQGGDTKMLMQQEREDMTVNQEMTDESNWIWLTSEQMGFPLRSEFANENHGEAGSSKQWNDQRTDQTAFFLAPIITDFSRNTKRELYDEKLSEEMRPTRMVQHG